LEALVYFLVALVSSAISLLQLLMVIRAVVSWLPVDDSSVLVRFLTVATEPVVFPVRILLEKIPFFYNLPIDLSFFVAYLLLIFVGVLLPAVHF